ncbi:MAG: 4-amino-4-deoxychorismate lyase, partial [Bacteroidota bacterium]
MILVVKGLSWKLMNQRFIESICFKSGNYQLLKYHQERVNLTFLRFFPEHKPHHLHQVLPGLTMDGLYKVRVMYTGDSLDIEYAKYQKKQIKSVQLSEGLHIDYGYKFEDRSAINALVKESEGDEIIIVKNDFITD